MRATKGNPAAGDCGARNADRVGATIGSQDSTTPAQFPNNLNALARALGGEVQGREVLAPGPCCSAKDRSLSVTLSPGAPDGLLIHSFAGDDWRYCRDHVRERLGMPAFAPQRRPLTPCPKLGNEEALSTIGVMPRQAPEPALEANPNTNRARAIWRESVGIKWTVAAAYLASRRLPIDDNEDWYRVLRFHPSCPFGSERAPAMIALMRDVLTNEPRCIQRTRLTPDGRKVDRLMLGPSKDAAIKIDADCDVTVGLSIAEGLETCLSGRAMGFKPAWALGSAGAIESFPILPGIDGLHIFREHDAPNERGALACAERWHMAGRDVFHAFPDAGSDLNDELRGAAL